MGKKSGVHTKLIIGLAISAIFLWLAFRKVDINQMLDAFSHVKYGYVLLGILTILVAHAIRAYRWGFLIEPIKHTRFISLFSALLIGYMANNFLPAHLGEFLRAYVIGKKEKISGSSAFATVALERVIDVITLLIITAVVLITKPFPENVQIPNEVVTSGYIMFVATAFLFGFLVLLKMRTEFALRVVRFFCKPLKQTLTEKIENILLDFTKGIVPLKRKIDYGIVVITSIVMWAFYALMTIFGFYAFDFIAVYNLNFIAAVVVLIITTISIVVPSSPGYIGTYHALCMLSVGLYGVNSSAGLSFAFVLHALNFIPVILIGFFFAWKEGLGLSKMSHREELELNGGDTE